MTMARTEQPSSDVRDQKTGCVQRSRDRVLGGSPVCPQRRSTRQPKMLFDLRRKTRLRSCPAPKEERDYKENEENDE